MNTVVILPTYNEAENIGPIIKDILFYLPNARVLVVDDDSPDGTGRIVEELSQGDPQRIELMRRPKKEGLGRAYLDAFRHVLKSDTDTIIQMDADFSHPPAILPTILDQLQKYDIVLGSRYIRGGGIKNWNLFRRILSKAGNLYAKTVLGLPVNDLTGGFKGFNRKVLDKIVHHPIDSQGYNFQIETTAWSLAEGFRLKEVPFVFTERKKGKSKMSNGIIFEALVKTYRLRNLLKNRPEINAASSTTKKDVRNISTPPD